MSTPRRTGIVDIHSHTYPRWYIESLKERSEIPRVSGDEGDERFVIFDEEESQGAGRAMTDDYWSIDTKLAFMDRHGIDTTLISLGNPWLDPFGEEAGLAAARRLIGEFAELGERTGGRVIGMGILPGRGVAAAVTILDEIAQEPRLRGIITGTRLAGLTFDDPALDDVWAKLEETGIPVLIHPHRGSAMDELGGFGHALPVGVGFPIETTVALTRLLFAGVLERFPGVRLIGSHGGGTLPYLAGRMDAAWRSDAALAERMPVPPSSVMDRLILDAVLYHPRALHAAADLVGTGRLAFGTDHPFSIADPDENIAAIEEAFDDDDAERVFRASARAIFGLDDPGGGGA